MNDPLVVAYQAADLRIAAEFFTNWLPFLTKDLCSNCMQTLTDRIHSLDPEASEVAEPPPENDGSDGHVDLSLVEPEAHDIHDNSDGHADLSLVEPGAHDIHDNSDGHVDLSLVEPEAHDIHDNSDGHVDLSLVEPEAHDIHDNCDTNSLGSWKESANEWSEDVSNNCEPSTPAVRISWADMAQEDELAEEEEGEVANKQSWADECDAAGAGGGVEEVKVKKKPALPREQREYIRFMKVGRKKDFICLERINGKIANVLDGLELHTGVFSAVEQKRIIDFVYELQEMGRKGQLKERTYSEPLKWMRGKGRVTIQFGCCYNYALDKNGNPPGIIRNEVVERIPHLFKVIIKRLIGWHVLPPTCVPDSCIVNIYEEGDCIPPHIDNHDFVRPFCTVSFLSECNILFGSNLKIVGPGEFSGSTAIPLPVGLMGVVVTFIDVDRTTVCV
ncbi:RNA demethylase ALKBH9B isoform X2 [Magnolia sinica]|uniref:RNA demethylase ALKBH9B isoform X2 n=1 Tax=Magnolia sinica TaxID=86752 RepID=UPI002658F065|nr:RNA demethylase ALKBH9B isoform X2 [Magnolia sinica]